MRFFRFEKWQDVIHRPLASGLFRRPQDWKGKLDELAEACVLRR
jgi:hypothetical protein